MKKLRMARHSALRLAHLRIVRLEARVAALAAELAARDAGGRQPWQDGPAGAGRPDTLGTLGAFAVLVVVVALAMALICWGARG